MPGLSGTPPSQKPRSSEKTPAIKGLVFREFARWYELTYGREQTMRAFLALPDDLRGHLDPDRDAFGLIASTWYPAAVASALLSEVTLGLQNEARADLLKQGVKYALGVTLTGVYRVLFETLVTPERHARYAQKIWNQYYNTGKVEGEMLGPNRSTQVVTEWGGHHPLLCELSLSSLAVFHEAMGCKNVRVRRTSCVLDAELSARHSERFLAGEQRRHSSSKISAVRAESSGRLPAAAAPLEPACRFLINWDF